MRLQNCNYNAPREREQQSWEQNVSMALVIIVDYNDRGSLLNTKAYNLLGAILLA